MKNLKLHWRKFLVTNIIIFLSGVLFGFLVIPHLSKSEKGTPIKIDRKLTDVVIKKEPSVKTENFKVRKLKTVPLEGVVSDVLPPIRIEFDINRPKVIKEVDPIYPEEARNAGIEGEVTLEVQTDIFGRIKNMNVLRPVDSCLFHAARDAMRNWVFEPMIVDDRPREAIFTIVLRFKK